MPMRVPPHPPLLKERLGSSWGIWLIDANFSKLFHCVHGHWISKKGTKSFPNCTAEILPRAAPPQWKERGILQPDVGPGLWRAAELRPSARVSTAHLSSLLLHTFPVLPRDPHRGRFIDWEPEGVWKWRLTYCHSSTVWHHAGEGWGLVLHG